MRLIPTPRGAGIMAARTPKKAWRQQLLAGRLPAAPPLLPASSCHYRLNHSLLLSAAANPPAPLPSPSCCPWPMPPAGAADGGHRGLLHRLCGQHKDPGQHCARHLLFPGGEPVDGLSEVVLLSSGRAEQDRLQRQRLAVHHRSSCCESTDTPSCHPTPAPSQLTCGTFLAAAHLRLHQPRAVAVLVSQPVSDAGDAALPNLPCGQGPGGRAPRPARPGACCGLPAAAAPGAAAAPACSLLLHPHICCPFCLPLPDQLCCNFLNCLRSGATSWPSPWWARCPEAPPAWPGRPSRARQPPRRRQQPRSPESTVLHR
jgi:hypothetical protein